MMIDYYLSEANQLEKNLIIWRRDFHRHPELGFQEIRSSNLIAQELQRWGYTVETGIAETGVTGYLQGKPDGKNVLVRVDMDALPIQEENKVEYASVNSGVMHACGHDAHMAIGLGAASILSKYSEQLFGSIKFVFQPAEEGLGGARKMVKEGILANPKPDIVLGLHLINELPVGMIIVRDGTIATSHDRLSIIVQGKGGHGAIPQLSIDPIVTSAQIISTLQTIISRNVSPQETGVVSITSINGDGAYNIIPDKVFLKGTIRAYESNVRELLHMRIRQLVSHVAKSMNCTVDLKIDEVNPALVNHPDVAAVVREAAGQVVGPDNVRTDYRSTGSDDVAYFSEHIPGCVFHIGSANSQKGLDFPGHHPRYDFDEMALVYGTATLFGAIDKFSLQGK